MEQRTLAYLSANLALSSKNATQEKVPSEVAYREEGILWGALIPADVPRHMWTKLQLDPIQAGEVTKINREIATSAQNANKQPDDVITDFLAQVKAHLIKNLDQKYGTTLWRTMPITLVVTVPATWSDLAKSRTLEAVSKAGFNTLEFPQPVTTILTTEPEAAAIHTIRTFRVTGLNPTVIEEATVGCGDQCGGSSVDRAFLRWLEGRIGTADFFKIAGCRSEEVKYTSLEKRAATMLQQFTSGPKAGFSGTESYIMPLPFPLSKIEDDEARGISDGEIQITTEDMESMYEKSLARTYKLIAHQYRAATDTKKIKMKASSSILFSPYMREKIRAFASEFKLMTRIPDNPWSSVSQGAVAVGLEAQKPEQGVVQNRKCRRHYGTPCNSSFQSGKHLEADAYIDRYSGAKKATNQAEWLLNKGQDLATTKVPHATMSFSTKFWPHEARTHRVRLIATNSDEAPQHSYDKGVFSVVTLTIDLSKVPKKEFKARRSPDRRQYHQISYEVEISIQSALQFSCSVEGKNVGSITAKYE
ncbi:hypothetical protein J4E89_004390 [Alternaria sp. Ai002NY15]|nr:hypothetical protein J4E89_004390 [Alternaria sp. Ai002NY15]